MSIYWRVKHRCRGKLSWYLLWRSRNSSVKLPNSGSCAGGPGILSHNFIYCTFSLSQNCKHLQSHTRLDSNIGRTLSLILPCDVEIMPFQESLKWGMLRKIRASIHSELNDTNTQELLDWSWCALLRTNIRTSTALVVLKLIDLNIKTFINSGYVDDD